MPSLENMSVRELLGELTRIADAIRDTPAFTDGPRRPGGNAPTLSDLTNREDEVVAALRARRQSDLQSPRRSPRAF